MVGAAYLRVQDELVCWKTTGSRPPRAGDKPQRYIPLTHTPQFGPIVGRSPG